MKRQPSNLTKVSKIETKVQSSTKAIIVKCFVEDLTYTGSKNKPKYLQTGYASIISPKNIPTFTESAIQPLSTVNTMKV